jgi:hypothetical protein
VCVCDREREEEVAVQNGGGLEGGPSVASSGPSRAWRGRASVRACKRRAHMQASRAHARKQASRANASGHAGVRERASGTRPEEADGDAESVLLLQHPQDRSPTPQAEMGWRRLMLRKEQDALKKFDRK